MELQTQQVETKQKEKYLYHFCEIITKKDEEIEEVRKKLKDIQYFQELNLMESDTAEKLIAHQHIAYSVTAKK